MKKFKTQAATATAAVCLITSLAIASPDVANAQEIRRGETYDAIMGLRIHNDRPLAGRIAEFQNTISSAKRYADDPIGELEKLLFGKVRRSCQGFYAVAKGGRAARVGTQFAANRSAGATVKNRARRRARNALHTCMDAKLANSPNAARLCSEQKAVIGFSIEGDVIELAERAGRTIADPGTLVELYKVSWGDKGCGAGSNRRLVVKDRNIRVR